MSVRLFRVQRTCYNNQSSGGPEWVSAYLAENPSGIRLLKQAGYASANCLPSLGLVLSRNSVLYYRRFCDEGIRCAGLNRRARALLFDFAFLLDGDRRVTRLII